MLPYMVRICAGYPLCLEGSLLKKKKEKKGSLLEDPWVYSLTSFQSFAEMLPSLWDQFSLIYLKYQRPSLRT